MNIMVISPHGDDETLGAGGSLLKFREMGHHLFWINVTSPKEEFGYLPEFVEKRKKEIDKVKQMYGFEKFYNLDLKPAGLDSYSRDELVGKFHDIIGECEPNILMLPYPYDIHSDHKIVFESAFACTKSFRFPYIKEVLCMEILSETDFAPTFHGFIPNYYINISEYIDSKINIMNIYESEIKEPPFPRSVDNIRSLARYRGGSCGYEYAEAFQLIKKIQD